MKIENKEMLLYSMNTAADSAVRALKEEDEKEVFYRVGTAIHWIVDCFDRIREVVGLTQENEKLLSAYHCANNALKHCVDFTKPHKKNYGYDYPYDYPIEFQVFYVWKDLSDVSLRYAKQKDEYQRQLCGKHIQSTIEETRKEINALFEFI